MADQYTILSKSSKRENDGLSKHFANRKILSDYLGIPYGTLTNHFIRDGHVWHYYEDQDVLVVRVSGVEKGRQRVYRKGVGHDRNI